MRDAGLILARLFTLIYSVPANDQVTSLTGVGKECELLAGAATESVYREQEWKFVIGFMAGWENRK